MSFHRLQFGSLPVGTLCGVPLRISFLIPIAAAIVASRLQDPISGIIVLLALLFSLLLREVVHLVACRQLGGSPGARLLWPLGGLCPDPTPFYESSRAFSCLISGSLCSLALVVSTAACLVATDHLPQNWLLPLDLSRIMFADDPGIRLLQFAFVINWNLLLINLVPVKPLDGGYLLQGWLNRHAGNMSGREQTYRFGSVLCLAGLITSLFFDHSGLAVLSGVLLFLQLAESSRWFEADLFSELEDRLNSGLIPDDDDDDDDDDDVFSQFHRDFHSSHFDEGGPGPSRRMSSETPSPAFSEPLHRPHPEVDSVDDSEVDQILGKLHATGRQSLTPRELAILNRASALLRQRNDRR